MSFITVNNVSKIYEAGNKVYALENVSLTVDEGEFVAIMGPSGSGKSTLLSILGVLNPPTTGTVIVDDINVFDLSNEKQADFRREYLGFVFQQFQLIPYLTAVENVMLPLAVTPMSKKDKFLQAEKALEKVGLGQKLHRLPHQLSGGEQGRVAIARAIVNQPPIILADEPTGSLDSATGLEIIQLFKELNKGGHTILMVTHNVENRKHVQRTIFIRDGKIVS
ncbi:MAG: ABC transporter ATP-binding protein [Clostridia bacterium]|nr:ABC transporter ATP-binding protein [Clostridia bacterium]